MTVTDTEGYVCCEGCGHFVAWQTERPTHCENCGDRDLASFEDVEGAEDLSQQILEE